MLRKFFSLFFGNKKTESPNLTQAASHKVFFSPGDTCTNAIIQSLQSAKTSVDICVFTISDDRISKEVVACHRRGVKIRIISDNDKLNDVGSDIKDFANKGIPVKIDMSTAHLHHKFAIFDKKTLINGSFNWTRSAAMQNQENIVLSDDKGLIRTFQQEFDRLWSNLEKYE